MLRRKDGCSSKCILPSSIPSPDTHLQPPDRRSPSRAAQMPQAVVAASREDEALKNIPSHNNGAGLIPQIAACRLGSLETY
ncbi:hypothetical protein Cob_v004393 [Colletotrichum orbiculare MAFF 240422]|uniref:Uncharacterized protein n=1 Tax=Colletotrichum orbiculare (strain 104-T / ATCC 96160 / CBS 514.97 / LARS 414 / MAFF 240422) TaxID=1213857 RepID=A0A484FZP3_COLOR|nr:hypothetical protein Cob_v004393 [Colletotrichum orbiculare MAFF 240422]